MEDHKIRCGFFSLVGKVKGADLVLDIASDLPKVEFHFYGRIEESFEHRFVNEISGLSNAEYHGVFNSVDGDVARELNQYGIHLLPTKWPDEGVPGVLVETKMVAVPSIVSDRCYNAEIVEDGVYGVVLKECSANSLRDAVSVLSANPSRLDEMKRAAFASAERFYIDRYVGMIVSELAE